MRNEDEICPICREKAEKSSVPGKMDFRISCRRCKLYDIDRRAEVNLSNGSDATNAAILSGIARHQYETSPREEPPRLVWVEVEGDRDGRYQFLGLPSERLAAAEKRARLMQYFGRQTDWTPGHEIFLSLPSDLSLAYARSNSELDVYLNELAKEGLIETENTSSTTRCVVLTTEGADYAHEPSMPKQPVSKLRILDVEILGDKIDSGLFGQVYAGFQQTLQRKVAIKVIQPETKPNAIDHALGLAKVRHPNVVVVYEVGSVYVPKLDAYHDCLVMDWIDGKPISKIWKNLTASEITSISTQLVDAIQACHDAGVVHHDLHAGNVMVTRGQVTLIDVQFTESARFSRISTEPKARLIEADWSAVARIIRTVIWSADAVTLPNELESEWPNAKSSDDVRSLLKRALAGQSVSHGNPSDLGEPASQFAGFSVEDRAVIEAAGTILVSNKRFDSWIPVDEIRTHIEKTFSIGEEEVQSSIRMLIEHGLVQRGDRQVPSGIMLSHCGFQAFLESKRHGYVNEVQAVKVSLVSKGLVIDTEIAESLQLPRPVVEQILHQLEHDGLIQCSVYNTGTHVHSLSEHLRRDVAKES